MSDTLTRNTQRHVTRDGLPGIVALMEPVITGRADGAGRISLAEATAWGRRNKVSMAHDADVAAINRARASFGLPAFLVAGAPVIARTTTALAVRAAPQPGSSTALVADAGGPMRSISSRSLAAPPPAGILDSLGLGARALGDMTPKAALGWCWALQQSSPRAAKLVRALCAGLPPGRPIRASITAERAEEIVRRMDPAR